MAKVNFGTIANDARGKINGTVYSKNKSGAYVRKKVTPANPRTVAQSLVRASFGGLSQAWSGTLTAAQRAAWIAYAATYPRLDIFGASITLSGLNMYISLNAALLNVGEPSQVLPPPNNVITPISTDYGSMVATVAPLLTFNQLAAASVGTDEYYIFASKPLPPGRTPQKSDFRFLTMASSAAGPYPATIDLHVSYIAKFGSYVAGQQIALLIATIDTTSGLTTVGVIMTAIVT
jgi:hypothetical protein